MTDRQAKAAAKRQRRAARPQGGSGPKQPKPEQSHYPWLGPRKVYAPPMAANSAALAAPHCTRGRGGHRPHAHRRRGRFPLAALVALCTGAPSAPPKPSPPPGKDRR